MGSLIFNTDYSLFLLNSCLFLGATSQQVQGKEYDYKKIRDSRYDFMEAV